MYIFRNSIPITTTMTRKLILIIMLHWHAICVKKHFERQPFGLDTYKLMN